MVLLMDPEFDTSTCTDPELAHILLSKFAIVVDDASDAL